MKQDSRIYQGLPWFLIIIASVVGAHWRLSQNSVNKVLKHSSPVNDNGFSGLKSVEVFQYGEGGFSCIRIPAITRCGTKGTLHAFAECRMSIGDGCIPFLRNNTETAQQGQIQSLCYKNSTDDGVTWSNLTPLAARGNNPTVVCDKRTNTILVQYNYALAWYSDDGGKTYTTSERILPNMSESVLVQLSNGSLMANMRNNQHARGVSISNDGGKTFQNVTYDATLISPGCQGTMLRTHNGSLIFANPASETSRTTGTVRRSDDDGKTWPHSFPVSDNRTAYAYSCLTDVDTPDEVGLLWETGSEGCIGPSCRIAFSKIKVL